ncbi:MAG: class I SAM-dependent methyltransferase [Thermogemmatispora sp.]|uniref:class I SAM-dependent methyltransferase n=1 Tax=Thermogemmatispora sp. TaxID=1968838 RepID=UPI00263357C9|nr:class I SAM-dependent methyltransferase [Thermogemmatispora sp.]MBX5456512.1 class I SAM-dependent methyltransferase [Thermogemmatispora sp.]
MLNDSHQGQQARPDVHDVYLLPRTASEQDRLEFQHYTLYRLLGTHFLAPVEHPRVILDVGTGTGIWAKEAARRWREAAVLTIDSNLALLRRLPRNCRVTRASLLEGLPVDDGVSDYTHQRFLAEAIPLEAWDQVLKELRRVTAIAGWIEFVELSDHCLNPGPRTLLVQHWLRRLFLCQGIQLSLVLGLPERLMKLGLIPQVREIVAPLWGSQIGKLCCCDVLQALRHLLPVLVDHLGLTPQEITQVLSELPTEWERYRTSWLCIAIWTQVL